MQYVLGQTNPFNCYCIFMNMFFKIALRVFLVLLVIIVIWIIGVIFWDEIKLQYNKFFWEPKLPFHELSPGMTKSDVIFVKGEPDDCTSDKAKCVWFSSEYSNEGRLLVSFENDEVSVIVKQHRPYGYSPPFRNVEELETILGEEDILSISKDYLTRRYTYLEWGITFSFTENNVEAVIVGDVRWRVTDDVSQYVIRGKVICPGDGCPWNGEGNLKPKFEGKSYRDFL